MYPPGRIMTTAGSAHVDGVNIVFCDGSTRFLSDTSIGIWRALGTINGGENFE